MPKSKRDKKLMEMARDGIRYPVIADKLGVSVATVSRLAIKYGLRTGQRRYVSEAMAEKWYKMKYHDGLTGTEIAQAEPFTIETVNMHIQRHKRALDEKNKKPKNKREAAIMAIARQSKLIESNHWNTLRRML